MSEQHYTRADWRPSKRRRHEPRKKPWGGKKPGCAPEAFLAAARAQAALGMKRAPVCTATKRDGEKCNRFALRGCPVCGAHGGWSIRMRRGEHVKTGKGEAIRAERASAKKAELHAGAVAPLELVRMAVYQDADTTDRHRLVQAWGTPAWAVLVRSMTR